MARKLNMTTNDDHVANVLSETRRKLEERYGDMDEHLYDKIEAKLIEAEEWHNIEGNAEKALDLIEAIQNEIT